MTQTLQKAKTPLHLRLTNAEWVEHFNRLTRAQLGVLYYIRSLDPFGDRPFEMDCSEVARLLGIHRTSVSRALTELNRLSLIDLEIAKAKVGSRVHNRALTLCAPMHTDVHPCTDECTDAQTCAPMHTTVHPCTNQGLEPRQEAGSETPHTIQTNSYYSNSLIQSGGEENSFDSEPEEEQGSSLITPVKELDQVDIPVRVVEVAEDQFSAAPPSTVFQNSPAAKCNALFNAGADAHDWEDYPGYPQPEFVSWYGDRYYDEKGAKLPKESWARTIIRRYPETAADAWAEYQAEQQRSEQVREQVSTPAESSIEQFCKPVEDVDQAEVYRIKAKIGIAQSLGRALDAATAARAKELGIEINSLESQVVSEPEPQPPVIPPAPTPAPAPDLSAERPNFSQLRSLLGMTPTAEPEDTSETIAAIQAHKKRLRWSEAQLDQFIDLNFCKASMQKLADHQLSELLELLKEEQ